MHDSIFTKIIKREIPAEILFEDEICIIILTVEPNNPGHSLIIPKQQIENWEDMPSDLFHYCMSATQALAKIIKKIYQPKKLGIATVGFDVPHVHIHLIPLYKIADVDHTSAKPSSKTELAVEAKKIRQQIEADGLPITECSV